MARYTEEEVEARMVPKLVEVLYPILIPFEQQDMKIQTENRARIEAVALATWRVWIYGPDNPADRIRTVI